MRHCNKCKFLRSNNPVVRAYVMQLIAMRECA